MEVIELKNSDQTKVKILVFGTQQKCNVTFICLPAMGVRASYYETFASTLCEQNFNVIIADWRGQGSSSVRASKKNDFGYKELLKDLGEVVKYASNRFSNTRIAIIGHSLGGQIGSLFTSRYPEEIESLVLLTSCSVFYKGWSNWSSLKVLIAGRLFYSMSRVIGYFPGNTVGFGGKEARTVMKDWFNTVISGKYKVTDSIFDYENALMEIKKSVLSISIKNDFLAPKKAVENLYNKFNMNSKITHIHLSEEDTKIKQLNHFNWAKESNYFVQIIKEWIQENN